MAMANGLIRAAGAVLWRRASGGLELVVIHRPAYDDWSLPKGKLDPGEEELAAALREVEEETGYVADPGAFLGETRYLSRKGGRLRPKVVRFWAMRAAGGGFVPNGEVDELRWLPPAQALDLLSYERDRDVVRRWLVTVTEEARQ